MIRELAILILVSLLIAVYLLARIALSLLATLPQAMTALAEFALLYELVAVLGMLLLFMCAFSGDLAGCLAVLGILGALGFSPFWTWLRDLALSLALG